MSFATHLLWPVLIFCQHLCSAHKQTSVLRTMSLINIYTYKSQLEFSFSLRWTLHELHVQLTLTHIHDSKRTRHHTTHTTSTQRARAICCLHLEFCSLPGCGSDTFIALDPHRMGIQLPFACCVHVTLLHNTPHWLCVRDEEDRFWMRRWVH